MKNKVLVAVIILGSLTLTPQKAHALPGDPQPVYGVWDSVVRTGQAAYDYGYTSFKYLYSYGWTTLQGVW